MLLNCGQHSSTDFYSTAVKRGGCIVPYTIEYLEFKALENQHYPTLHFAKVDFKLWLSTVTVLFTALTPQNNIEKYDIII